MIEAHYNEALVVREGLYVRFPDFVLRYDGETTVTLPEKWIQTHPGSSAALVNKLFTVSHGDKTLRIEYGGGFGLFGKRKFSINGRDFVLQAVPAAEFSITVKPIEEEETQTS